jgi:hypothetical protein
LYWVDNVVGGFAMAIRIAEHRRLTGVAGHGRAQLNAVVTASSERKDGHVPIVPC